METVAYFDHLSAGVGNEVSDNWRGIRSVRRVDAARDDKDVSTYNV